MAKFNIKKNDTVVVLAGEDKGKTGKVLNPFPRKELSPREALAVCTPPAPKPSARTPGS